MLENGGKFSPLRASSKATKDGVPLPKTKPDTVRLLNTLSAEKLAANKPRVALKLANHSVKRMVQIPGASPLPWADTMYSRGMSLLALKQPKQALHCLESAIAHLNGDQRSDTRMLKAKFHLGLGLSHLALQQTALAAAYFQASADTVRGTFSHLDRVTAPESSQQETKALLGNLFRIYLLLGQTVTAQALIDGVPEGGMTADAEHAARSLDRARRLAKSVYGVNSEQVQHAETSIGDLLLGLEQPAEALVKFEQAYRRLEQRNDNKIFSASQRDREEGVQLRSKIIRAISLADETKEKDKFKCEIRPLFKLFETLISPKPETLTWVRLVEAEYYVKSSKPFTAMLKLRQSFGAQTNCTIPSTMDSSVILLEAGAIASKYKHVRSSFDALIKSVNTCSVFDIEQKLLILGLAAQNLSDYGMFGAASQLRTAAKDLAQSSPEVDTVTYAKVLKNYAASCSETGQHEKARKYMQRALNAYPSEADSYEGFQLDRLECIRLIDRNSDAPYEAAIRTLQDTFELQSRMGRPVDEICVTLRRMIEIGVSRKQADRAEFWWKKLEALDDNLDRTNKDERRTQILNRGMLGELRLARGHVSVAAFHFQDFIVSADSVLQFSHLSYIRSMTRAGQAFSRIWAVTQKPFWRDSALEAFSKAESAYLARDKTPDRLCVDRLQGWIKLLDEEANPKLLAKLKRRLEKLNQRFDRGADGIA